MSQSVRIYFPLLLLGGLTEEGKQVPFIPPRANPSLFGRSRSAEAGEEKIEGERKGEFPGHLTSRELTSSSHVPPTAYLTQGGPSFNYALSNMPDPDLYPFTTQRVFHFVVSL